MQPTLSSASRRPSAILSIVCCLLVGLPTLCLGQRDPSTNDSSPTGDEGSKQVGRANFMGRHRTNAADVKLLNPVSQAWEEFERYFNSPFLDDLEHLGLFFGDWQSLGPSKFKLGHELTSKLGGLGRVNCIALDPSHPQRIYVGAAAGGLWESDDDGLTWVKRTRDPRVISVSDLAINSDNTDQIFLLTGDGNGSVYTLIPHSPSLGVLVSEDRGKSWDYTGLNWSDSTTEFGFKLVIAPYDNSMLFVAANSGLYKSSDQANTWKKVMEGQFRDIEFQPGSTSVMFASTTTQVFRSTNSGQTWKSASIHPNWGTVTPGNAARVELAVTDAGPDTVYALFGGKYGYVGMYRSDDAAQTFELRSNSPNILGYSYYANDTASAAKYTASMAVSPFDPDVVHIGGVNTWKSTDGGTSWHITSYWDNTPRHYPFMHADIHALQVRETGESTYELYSAHDGGISKSEGAGETWVDLSSGLSISQTFRICGTPENRHLLYFGAEDNGSSRLHNSIAHTVSDGDGGECLIDYTNSDIVYTTMQQGQLLKSTDGGRTTQSIRPPGSHSGQWVTPYVMHPTDPKTLYICYTDLWKTEDAGATWTNVTQGDLGTSQCVQIAIAPSNPDYLYVAKPAAVYRSNNDGENWSFRTNTLPDTTQLTDLAVSSNDPDHAWVTLSGYAENEKVFETKDAGYSWENVSGSLPNVPVNTILFESPKTEGVYIGTDIGIFYRSEQICQQLGICDWVPFSRGLPPLIVLDLEIFYDDGGWIRAATFGRGVWESNLFTPPPSLPKNPPLPLSQ